MAVGMKKQSAVSAKQTLIAKTDKMAAENVLYSAANVLQILRHFHLCLTHRIGHIFFSQKSE